MKYLQIVKWNEWQTFRTDRGTPPWIKVHRNLLTNPEWAALSDSEKGQLVSIWLIAADKDGRVPADEKLLQKVALLDKPPNINRFKDLEFLASSGCQDDVNSPQDDAPETETDKRQNKHFVHFDSESAFEEIWTDYPNPTGKQAAKKFFVKAVTSEDEFGEIHNSLKNYKAYVEKERIGGFKDLRWQGGSRWFNPKEWKNWLEIKPQKIERRPTGEQGVFL
jgi:hypothetical protein